jgi:hypothetical protein
MTNAEYLSLQNRLVLIGDLIRMMDLNGFLARIELTHLLGPVIEPALYARTQEYLLAIERLARAAQALKNEAAKLPCSPKPDEILLQFLNAKKS